MKIEIRAALVSTALMAAFAVIGATPANAQVSFQGFFPLPRGSISIAIGDPGFAAGTFVPLGYRVASRPGYGYGFGYRDRWIPVRRYSSGWIVCGIDDAYRTRVHTPSYYDPRYDVAQAYGYRGYGRYDRHGGRRHGHSHCRD